MSVDHYENFPVASLLLPRRLRTAVRDIYRYARTADDIADEGDAPAGVRQAALAGYREALAQIEAGGLALPPDDPRAPVFVPLADTIRRHTLPLAPFFDLLSAFDQDTRVTHYETDTELFDYCRRSANPVGRLMLHLYGAATPGNLAQSDAICTGLQLANFWQDVALDWHKGRMYIPRQALERHGVSVAYVANRAGGGSVTSHAAWQALMREQVQQARSLLLRGQPLARRLPGRIGFELRLVVLGGLRILERLDQLHYDVFRQRPVLAKKDWALLLWRALH
ncbi:squalene synthase HpnC [Pusillimonas sp. TS35]|uniref:squalene synthase HpnC n=1 Tax=Paracandidimonas lactea TaxID=2895524 RepID=UPI0013693011|nr:squalene synthase HpnC [Paracandidimonas lactea]MYN13829.1 squalene synthase HpnC [Pusillimonas sp. TS35]